MAALCPSHPSKGSIAMRRIHFAVIGVLTLAVATCSAAEKPVKVFVLADAVFRKGWRDHVEEWETVGSNYPYHYLGSSKTFCAIGRAFGEAVLKLREESQ